MHYQHLFRKALFVVGLGLFAVAGMSAQETGQKDFRPSIQVTGEATVQVKPDQAQIEIGVITQARTAQAAANQNRQQFDAVLVQLRQALGPTAEVQTASYIVEPNYRESKQGTEPTIIGYTATNVVQVKINNLGEVGKAIDVASQSGANNIQRLQFTLQDAQAVRLQALGKAAIKAKAQADVLAEALGLKVVRVLSVAERQQMDRPLNGRSMSTQAATVRPSILVEPGTIEIQAFVVLTVEISQR